MIFRKLFIFIHTVIVILYSLTLASHANEGGIEASCMPIDQQMNEVNLLPFLSHYADINSEIAVPDTNYSTELTNALSLVNFDRVINPGKQHTLGEGNQNHWLRFCLSNSSGDVKELMLMVAPAVIAEIDFYPQKASFKAIKTGNALPMDTREVYAPDFHFTVVLDAFESQNFYIRINSRNNAFLAATIWDKKSYLVGVDRKQVMDGIFAGVLIGLILYTVLLYAAVRQSSSLLYIMWSVSTLILFASIDGRVLQYFLPNNPVIAYGVTLLFYPLCLTGAALFGREFINLKNCSRLDLAGKYILCIGVIVLLIAYTFGYSVYLSVAAAYALTILIFFGLIAPVYGLLVKNSQQAKYLLISQLPLVVCMIDRSLFNIGLSDEYFVPYTPKAGLAADMVLLAYFIGQTVYLDKDNAQQLALEQLTLSNNLKSNYNAELEAEISRNTTEIRGMNKNLEKQAEQLIESVELKSRFFANISHEFRTPLTLIKGPLNRLIEKGFYTDDSEDAIRGAIRHSDSLGRLIDQLLTLSKFDAGSLTLKASKLNISDAVRTITAQFESLAVSKGVDLSFNTKSPYLEAFVDFDKLQVIVNNLLSNALKFTLSGGQVSVEICSLGKPDLHQEDYATDEYFQIIVCDSGHGIPADELELVFDRFFQSNSSSQAGSGSGTGIGLALVKELVGLHAGDVYADSSQQAKPENGEPVTQLNTRFIVSLPLGQAHLNSDEIVDSPAVNIFNSGKTEELNNTAGKLVNTNLGQNGARTDNEFSSGIESDLETVLVVDDNEDMRNYIRSILESDYRVIEAVDGITAEQALQNSRPDMIVTDLMMPNRDGLEFVQTIKKDADFATIPVIMLTAKVDQNSRLKGLGAEVDDYLAKPFDATELTIRIKNLLIKQRQLKEFYSAKTDQNELAKVIEDRVSRGVNDPLDDDYINKLRSIIDNNLSNSDFGVIELADLLHVSKATLHRQVNTKLNVTPSAFIRSCRLDKARELVLKGEHATLDELSNAVGFSQSRYFARIYKNAFGEAPINDLFNSAT